MEKLIFTKRVKFYNVKVYTTGVIWSCNWNTMNTTVLQGNTRRGVYAHFRFVHKKDVPHFIKKCIAHGVTPPPVMYDVLDGKTPCAMYYNTTRSWS